MGSWYPSKPQIVKNTKTKPGEDDFVSYSHVFYNSNGLPSQTVSNPGTTNEIKTDYAYNAYGLPTPLFAVSDKIGGA